MTDTFPGGTAVTPRYSEDRVRLDGGADYALAHWMTIGVGGKFNDIHYGPGQVITNTQETQSWGRATLTPLSSLSFTLKIGDALRKTSSFDDAALPPEENPLIRESDYAPRIGCLLAHRCVDRDLNLDLVGAGLSRQGRLSIIALGPAKRARRTRVDQSHLDAARYAERLHRRRIRALVQPTERVWRESTRHRGSPPTPSGFGT